MKGFEEYNLGMGITQSMLQNFLACRWKMLLSLKQGWSPNRQKASFRFGTLVHDAIEFYYNGVRADSFGPGPARQDRAISLTRKHIQTSTEALIRQASAREDELEEDGAVAEALLSGYIKHWKEDWNREWVIVEGEFKVPFQYAPSHSINLRGKRDAAFVDHPKKGSPGLWLLETKTKSQISEEDLDLSLAFDFQSLIYLLALETDNPTPHPVRGCLYNILRKPSLRPYEANTRRKKAEDSKEYLARVLADIKAKPDHYYKRFEIVFPKEVRAEFRAQLELQIGEFAAWWEGRLPSYRNTNSCVTKYRCEFLDFCSQGNGVGYSQTRKLFPELAPQPSVKPTPVGLLPVRHRLPVQGENHGCASNCKTPAPALPRPHRRAFPT